MEPLPFFVEAKQIFLTLHLLAVAIGFGGATITDVLFFRFLKDFLISHKEEEVMRTLASIVLTAMLLIIASGFALYFGDPAKYDANPRFWVKMVAVLVACVNGLAMHLYLSPRLLKISFNLEHTGSLDPVTLKSTRRLGRYAFAMGAISAVSWWTAFLIAMLKSMMTNLSFGLLCGIYAGALVFGILVSQIIETHYTRRATGYGRLTRTWTATSSE